VTPDRVPPARPAAASDDTAQARAAIDRLRDLVHSGEDVSVRAVDTVLSDLELIERALDALHAEAGDIGLPLHPHRPERFLRGE
jgi:hypothetical protein